MHGDRTAKDAVTKFTEGVFAGLVLVDFDSADAWYEEDEPIFVHPKDPYKVCLRLRLMHLHSR